MRLHAITSIIFFSQIFRVCEEKIIACTDVAKLKRMFKLQTITQNGNNVTISYLLSRKAGHIPHRAFSDAGTRTAILSKLYGKNRAKSSELMGQEDSHTALITSGYAVILQR